MNERLRLALEQAIDAEIEAQKLSASICPRVHAVHDARILTRHALKKLRACVMRNADLILDNVGGAGIQAFGLRIHAMLTKLATDEEYDFLPEEDSDYAK